MDDPRSTCRFYNYNKTNMFVEKPKEEVYDVIINEVTISPWLLGEWNTENVSFFEQVLDSRWPPFIFAACFSSRVDGCGLAMCMQDSTGKKN